MPGKRVGQQDGAPGKRVGQHGDHSTAQVGSKAGDGHGDHSATQAGQGAAQLGKVYGAWGSDAQFAVVDSKTESHHGDSGHERVILQRVGQDDTARANRVFQAAMEMFDNISVDQTLPDPERPGTDHRRVSPEMKQQWKERYPGLPVPNRVIFDLKSGRSMGLLFVGGEKAPDLGMGALHQHNAGGAIMQHIWFTPGNMELAFGDATVKSEALKLAKAR
jgi:hypothetical protein